MFTTKVAGAAALLVVLGGAAACGSSDSSSPAASPSIPTTADKTTFCTTLQNSKSPQDAVDSLTKLGTPSDIDAASRHGFEVLLDEFKALPPSPQPSDLTSLEKKLSTTDQKDIQAFGAYVTKECVSSTPSAPAS
jgi:hypothetical protein